MPAIGVYMQLGTLVISQEICSWAHEHPAVSCVTLVHKLPKFVGSPLLQGFLDGSLLVCARLCSCDSTLSQAVIMSLVRRAIVRQWLFCWDLKAFQYCACSSCHCLAIHPSNAKPHPMRSWSCPAMDPTERSTAKGLIMPLLWLSTILCQSCGCVFMASSEFFKYLGSLFDCWFCLTFENMFLVFHRARTLRTFCQVPLAPALHVLPIW